MAVLYACPRVCLCCKSTHIRGLGKHSKPTFKHNVQCRMVTVKVATMSLQNMMMSSLMTQSSTSTMVGTGTNQSILGFSSTRYCLSIPENLTRRNMKPMEPCYNENKDTLTPSRTMRPMHQSFGLSGYVSHQSLFLSRAELCISAHPGTKHTARACEQPVCRAKLRRQMNS